MADTVDYSRYILKTYKFWTVYLNANQAYLGRCYIALHRDGNLDPFLETTEAERRELGLIVAAVQKALNGLYQPDIYNYANLRNTWPKCHWHIIPRYRQARTINGCTFRDRNWGKNYAPYDRNFTVSEEVMAKILQGFSAALM